MDIIKPIFIIGAPRSGTTILSKMFTRHKDTSYFEHFIANYFHQRWKFRFIPLLHKYEKLRYGNKRSIPANGGFFYRSLEHVDERQVTDETREYYYKPIRVALKLFNAKRFVNKGTHHAFRLRWLNELFPDAYYVIIWRDPKPIISSHLIKTTQKALDEKKEKFGKDLSNLETCIKHYEHYKNHLLQDLPLIKDRAIEINYETFVKNPREELKGLYEFTELHWYDDLEKDVPEHLELLNNEKWKTLPEHEKELLIKTFPN